MSSVYPILKLNDNVSPFCRHIISTKLESDDEDGLIVGIKAACFGYNFMSLMSEVNLAAVIILPIYNKFNFCNGSFDLINDLILPLIFKTMIKAITSYKNLGLLTDKYFIQTRFINSSDDTTNYLKCSNERLDIKDYNIHQIVNTSLYQHGRLWNQKELVIKNSMHLTILQLRWVLFRKCRFMDVIYGYKYDFVVMLKEFIIALTFRNHYYLESFIDFAIHFQSKKELKYIDYGESHKKFARFMINLNTALNNDNSRIFEPIFMAAIKSNSVKIFKMFENLTIFKQNYNNKLFSKAIQALAWMFYDDCSVCKDLFKYLVSNYPTMVNSVFCIRNSYTDYTMISYEEPNALYFAILREDMDLIKIICSNVKNLNLEYFLNKNNCLQLAMALNNLEIFIFLSEVILKRYNNKDVLKFEIDFDNNLNDKWKTNKNITKIGDHDSSLISLAINTKNRYEFFKYMFWDCGFPNKYCLFFYYNPVLKKYTASKRFKCAIQNAFMVDNYPVLECILSNHFPYELFEPCCTIKDDNINNSITIF